MGAVALVCMRLKEVVGSGYILRFFGIGYKNTFLQMGGASKGICKENIQLW